MATAKKEKPAQQPATPALNFPGIPVNPDARKLAALRAAFVSTLTEERMAALSNQLYDQAVGGDVAAMEVLIRYVLGDPWTSADPDQLDADEWKALTAGPTPMQAMEEIKDGADPTRAFWIFHKLRPGGAKIIVDGLEKEHQRREGGKGS